MRCSPRGGDGAAVFVISFAVPGPDDSAVSPTLVAFSPTVDVAVGVH